MILKDILVCYTAGSPAMEALSAGLTLAGAGDGHVTVAAVAADLSSSVLATAGSADASFLLVDAVEKTRKEAEDAATALAEAATVAAQKSGVRFDVRRLVVGVDVIPDTIALHARYADLAVIGHAPDRVRATVPLIEAVVFRSGRPALVVPEGVMMTAMPRRVLVAWDAGRESARALNDALPLLEKAEKITVLTVGGGGKPGYGDLPGADIALHLARHGLEVETVHEKDTAEFPEQVMLRKAREGKYDLVVMGAWGHSRLRQWILGGVTRAILQGMTTPVFMAH
ncbi:MAG: universal stress protein [Pseudomonadota bacterium]|nr:universal stress protein [Pseudomonadota bacterium]